MGKETHDQSVPKNFPERLRKLRKAQGYTQEELGRIADVHNVNLSRYERGLSNPSAVVLKRLAEALDVSVGHLVEGDPNEIPPSRLQDPELRQHIEEIERLPEKERLVVKDFLEAFLFRHRVRGLAN
jgi:transcriptional regulator with XRE-family HTH domain